MGKTKRPWHDDAPVRVGISACLLGEEVRWDGGHKRDRYITDVLGPHVTWVPVCPELEIGMGVPREPVSLVRQGGEVRMVGVESGKDWTRRMNEWSERRARELGKLALCGYVLKKGSPSCGMERVKLRSEQGRLRRAGRGLFADALLRRNTTLPVEEEGRLSDPVLRESFIERLFAYRRLHALFAPSWRLHDLVSFHTAHRLQLMSHSPQACRTLGRMVACAKQTPRSELSRRYASEFMTALSSRATRQRHANVLKHCLGTFGKRLEPDARAEILALIEDYRAERVPRVVPITMIRHHVRRLGIASLADQVYLTPDPRELMLRNHV